jgi:hypothetical protein
MSGTPGLALGRVVVRIDGPALAAPREWAWAMEEAGADALALQARPEDPTTAALLDALAEAGLPLELHVPGPAPQAGELDPVLAAHPLLTAVVPAAVPDPALADQMQGLGCALAWPGDAGSSAPAGVWRWHWEEGAATDTPAEIPAAAPFERSLGVTDPDRQLPVGVTSVVVPAAALDAVDPGATIARLRPAVPLPSGSADT